MRERLTKAGVVVQGSTADAFGKHMAAEFARWNRGARGGRHCAAVALMRLRFPSPNGRGTDESAATLAINLACDPMHSALPQHVERDAMGLVRQRNPAVHRD